MSRSLPRDSEARTHAVHDDASVLVQAPAGSGKTTLLTQRYLRLLASVDAPERILALTFTRRAAEEMRQRVIAALAAAALAECPPGFNAETWRLAVGARERLGTLGIDVQRQPSRLRIETIDSFNFWLASQLPIVSGVGGRLNVVGVARSFYEEAARRALAHEGTDLFAAAVERTLAVGDQRWRQLVGLIAGMLAGRDRWLPLLAGRLEAAAALDAAQLDRVREHFDEDLALLVTRGLQAARDALGGEGLASLPPLMRAAARRLGAERPELAAWLARPGALAADATDLERWRTVADTFLTKGGQLRKRFTRTEGFPPQCPERDAMIDLSAQFERRPGAAAALQAVRALPEPRYRDEDWIRVRDVAQVLVLAAAELDEVFRERATVDFAAVSLAGLRALGAEGSPTDLALRLDYRLQHLLLDEFQDTSGAQLELVRMLTLGWQRGDGRSVFCVGDPMQSIYGFRQAEVRAFLELAETGIGDLELDVRRLSSNFRSSPALVQWVNACFERIMPQVDDRQRGAIAFRPSDSEVEASFDVARAVSLRGFMSAAAEAKAVAELIESRRTEHPEWRIAILVRARAHARDIALALRGRGIPFRAVDIEPLQDRAVVRDLVMLIRALIHLGDRTAWLAVLRAPWSGLPLSELLTIARSGSIVWDSVCDEAVLRALSAEGAERCRRLRKIFEDAFRVQTHTSLVRWVERSWLALGGPACATDERGLAHVRTVFARLRELGEQGLPDAAELERHFADLYADGGAAGAVEIMTIHKAKGLEFDLVVVPGLDRHARQDASQLLLTHQFARTGRDGMIMAARPAVGAGTDRLFEFLRTQARDASALEAQRLLYVACTRAKAELHLYAAVGLHEDPDAAPGENSEESPDVRAPRAGSLLAVLWPTVGGQFVIEAQGASGNLDTPALRGGPLRRVPAGWAPPPVADGQPAVMLRAADLREEAPIFDWVGETARRVGSLVHAELQSMDLEIHYDAAARGPHFARWLALNGVPREHLREASERAIAALIAVRADPRGRWILEQRHRDDFREHAVSGYWRGEVMRAVFDRSFIDEHGVRWVIDYKTSRHAGSGLEEFLEREVERYRPQLERYAELARRLGPEPVRVGLYFPLMRAWREWEPGQS
ncbi:MAG TPA: UvrD-helicase domain-containing protein [Steroidobacteraceae bacterium]|nr:UvrD-helicase domain-containing protein [Steroidobacteraceae bacterium]